MSKGYPVTATLSPDSQGAPDRQDHSSVARHGGLLSFSAAIVGVLSYTCTLLMTNALTPSDFSQFAAAQMLLGMVGVVTTALVPFPLSHAVAAHPAGSDARRDAMAFAVMLSVIAGLAAGLLTGAVAAGLGSPPTAAVVALSSFVLFMGAAPLGWFQGELRFLRYSLMSTLEILVRFLFSLLVIIYSWGAPGAVLGFAVGGLALLVTPVTFLKDLRWRPSVLKQKWRWTETADIALTLCVVSVLVGLDVVVIAFLDGGSPATAGFQALASIAKAPVYVAAGTVIVVFPILRRPGVRVADVLSAALGSFSRLAMFSFAVIATVPHTLVMLVLPVKYHESLVLLPVLAIGALGYAALTVFATVLLGLRSYRRCQIGLLLAMVLIPAGLFLGWEADGASGLAVGCAVGSILSAATLVGITHPLLPRHRGYFVTKGLVKAAAFVLFLETMKLLPVAWIVAVALSGLFVLLNMASRPASRSATGHSSWRATSQGATTPWYLLSFWAHSPAGDLLLRALRLFAPFTMCAAVAFAVRSIGLLQSFELWVDEMLYALLGQSVSDGRLLPQLPDGPFFLHPPGFFWLEGAVINLFGVSGDNLELVMQLRWLNAALGAITVGLAFLIVDRVGNRPAAWCTAALLTFEPFVLRSNSHVFLETLAMAAVLGGLLLLVTHMERTLSGKRPLYLVLAGLLMGYGVLSKDFFALCSVVPLLAAVVWRKTIRRQDSVAILVPLAVPYLAYMCIVTAEGMLPDWIRAKASGLERLVGLEKSTGFTSEGSPGLLSRLIDNAGHFGSSYILLGLCPLAAVLICFSTRPERRLVGLISVTLGFYGLYSAAFGTFEEQYGYGVMIAGVLSSSLLCVELLERRPLWRKRVAWVTAVMVLLTSILGLRLETSTDNGFAHVKRWVASNLPADAKVAVTNSTGEFAFAHDRRFGVWPSAPLMLDNGANYMLTQSLPTSQGYGYVDPGILPWLEANAVPMIQVPGLTNGTTTLWYVDPMKLAMGARIGAGTPSTDYENER